ncbi:tail length tape measure protein [Pantoea phage PdC23]|uniref:Uncharacterized protein n=1 Tax=Pantoea phage PdC23 TaxID=2894356 RepID=A0AAE8YH46_9CAUD|nr:tail length tape measure protein [Pantoea phage PdC23]UGC97728.1 hypothetical protein pdc_015 [Pantoea phage PdC23]
MAAKSILEIDIEDDKWKAFIAAYQDYQSTLSEMPREWQAVGASIAKATNPIRQVSDEVTKASKSQSGMQKAAGETSKLLKGGADSAKKMAADIKDATTSLLRWGSVLGVFSGLVGAGGLFGINRMALGAAATRFTAQGLGTTAGGLNSTGVNFQRALGNPVGTLGAIRDAQADLSRRWAFNAIGVNPNGDPAQMLPQMIRNARDIYTRSGSTLQGAEAHGLTQFFSIDDLNRFKKMSDEEIDAMAKRAQSDARQMEINDATLRKWQDFNVQLDRSGVNIRNAFITGLAPLEPQLERLSKAVSDFLTSLLKSPQFGQWMDSASQGLEKFANYLTSPEFEQDARQFMDVLAGLTRAIGSAATWLANKFGGGGTTNGGPTLTLAPTLLGPDRHATLGPNGLTLTGGPVSERNNNPVNLRSAPGAGRRDGFALFGSKEAGFLAGASQLQRYGSGATFGRPVNTVSEIIGKWAPSNENDTQAYINNVVKRTGYGANQQLDLNDATVLAKLLSAMSKQENSKSNYSAEQVRLIIENNTGGNAVVSGAQLAGN